MPRKTLFIELDKIQFCEVAATRDGKDVILRHRWLRKPPISQLRALLISPIHHYNTYSVYNNNNPIDIDNTSKKNLS